MFGSHLSIAGGLENALLQAHEYGMDCVQVFTKNQRQWNTPPLTDDQIERWFNHQKNTGITDVVSHDSYLINLASPKKDTRQKSIDLFREELTRCAALSIPHLVTHPGAHMKEGEAAGLQRVADAINMLYDELGDIPVTTCLEITAGQGTQLGCTLEHLATLIDAIDAKDRMAVCLDTAHLLAAGYNLTTAPGAKQVLKEVDQAVGLDRVKALHLNDSKVPRGSHVDRHEHIGHGYVAKTAFGVIVNEPRFARVPKVLETAKGEAPDGRPWDLVNLQTLRGLARRGRGIRGGAAEKNTRKS